MKFTKLIASLAAITTVVTSFAPVFTLTVRANDGEFMDAYNWAFDNELTTKETYTAFNGGASVTRAQAAKFFVMGFDALGLDNSDTAQDCDYADLDTADQSLVEFIQDGCDMGIFKAQENFNPNQTLPRRQGEVIIARGLYGMSSVLDYADENDMTEAEAARAMLMEADVVQVEVAPMSPMQRLHVILMLFRISEMDIDMSEDCTVGVDCPIVIPGTGSTGEVVIPRVGTLDVTLSASTPSANEVPASSSGLPVARFDFTAGSSDVTINSVTLMRKGFSDDDTLDGVALTAPTGRVTKAKDENSTDSTVVLTISNGGYVLRAGTTVTLTVVTTVADAATAANDTFGFQVMSVSSSAATTNVTSITSPFMRVSSQDGPVVDFTANGTSSDVKLGQNNVEVAKFKITNNNSDQTVTLKSLTLEEIGTVDENTELRNFALYVDGVQFGATVPSIPNRFVTFTSTNGVVVPTNNNVKLVVKVDVIGGPNDTIRFELDNLLDFSADGSRFGAGVGINGTAPIQSAAAVDINPGEIVLEDIDAPSDKMKEGKDDVILGKIRVTNVAGKNLELQQFGVKATLTTGSATINSSAVTLATLFDNFEVYNESNGTSYELDLAGSVYSDSAIDLPLGQGVTTLVIRADTADNIADFDTASVDLELTAGAIGLNGGFYVIETEDDEPVTDITPSSLSWKTIDGTESSATVSLTPLADMNKVRWASNLVALQFNVEADESSALTIDEVQVNVQKDTDNTPVAATNTEISKVSLYKGTVSATNLLDEVGGSQLAAGIATFDGFETDIAANMTQAYIVTISFVDGADTVTNSDYKVSLVNGGISIEDVDNDPVVASYPVTLGNRDFTITNAGVLTATEDLNNVDNKDSKTILGGTSANVYSIDVQATNEDIEVDTVVFTVDTDLTDAATNASLYLRNPNDNSMAFVASNTNSDITATTITFDDLSTFVIPQQTRELVLKINTETIGFEKAGEVIIGANVTDVAFTDMEGADSGKPVANVTATAVTSADFDIAPVTVVASLTAALSANTTAARMTVTINKGDNTIDASNAAPQATITDFNFSELGNNSDGYKIYKEGNAGLFGTISSAWVFAQGTMPNADLIVSSSTTYVIVPMGTVDDTYSPVLLKNGIEYSVAGVAGATTLTSYAADDLELGSKTY